MATPITDQITASNWRDHGSCRKGSGYDPEIWFPTARPGSAAYAEQAKEPKSICREFCPARSMCLAWALEQPRLTDGIFGGLDADERSAVKRRANRRRPATVTTIHPNTTTEPVKTKRKSA